MHRPEPGHGQELRRGAGGEGGVPVLAEGDVVRGVDHSVAITIARDGAGVGDRDTGRTDYRARVGRWLHRPTTRRPVRSQLARDADVSARPTRVVAGIELEKD